MIEFESFASTRPEELGGIVGKHLFFCYANGWQHELYVKNATTVDYRIHSGLAYGRWLRDQKAHIVRLAESVYKLSWEEPTGTCVSLTLLLADRRVHGTLFMPNWIAADPKKTIGCQNDRMRETHGFRNAGPTYPKLVVDEFAEITFAESCAADDESVICCGPEDLPDGYADRKN